jgi:hypothetical protein
VFEGCNKKLTEVPADKGAVSGSTKPVVVGIEAHIVAEKDDGPRGDPSMPIPERNAYPNLILLCGDDHTLVDKDHGIHYSVKQLHKMKADHEAMVDRRLSEVESETEARSRRRQETLLEASSASHGRLVAQWLAAGVDAELAQELADDPAVGEPARLDQALPATGLVVIEGNFGSGKSVSAERIYAADNASAIEDDSAPLPLWLAAKSVTGALIDAVRTALEGLGDLNRNGVRLVLDGLDEPGQARASELLNEARALPFTWTNTRVVMTARPGLPLTQNEVKLPYPALSEDEVAALAERLGSDHRWLWGQPESIRQMLHLPLFLIVATLRQQAGAEIPRSQGTFLDALAKAALDRSHQPTDQARQALQSLAQLTIESGGAVPAAELGSDQAVRAVLETRLVVREGRSLRFALPVVEQYFAARLLLESGLDALDLNDLSVLDRWRDTLTLAVTIGSWSQASALLDILSARYPGLAASVVADAVPRPTTEPSTGLPSHAECARRIHHALAAWVDALGPIGKHLNVTDGQGRLLTVGAAANGGVAAGLRLGENHGVDAMRLPPMGTTGIAADGSVWAGLRAANVPGEYPAWPWQWALDWVVDDLEILLKAKVLPLLGCKPYNDERRWQLAKCLTGKHRSLAHNPIDGADLRRIAAEVLAQLNEHGIPHYQAGLGRQAVVFSREEIALLVRELDEGEILAEDRKLHRPYPAPDRQPTSFVRELYSDESLRTLIEQVHTNALLIYHDLTIAWFPAVSPTLGLASFMPILISGQLARGVNPSYHGVPQLTFRISPLPLTDSSRAEIRLVEPGDFPEFDLQRAGEQFLLLRQQIASLHPGAEGWAFPQAAASAISLWHDRPATSLAYHWLWGDLRRLHLVKRLPPSAED